MNSTQKSAYLIFSAPFFQIKNFIPAKLNNKIIPDTSNHEIASFTPSKTMLIHIRPFAIPKSNSCRRIKRILSFKVLPLRALKTKNLLTVKEYIHVIAVAISIDKEK